jgi:cysteine synthase A
VSILDAPILGTIGNTRLVPLRHIVPEGSARILVKLEYENPTGSMKDRMALAMVSAAEADGRLKLGGAVVEYTGGSTGVSLAFVCAAKRIPLELVTSEVFSREKRDHTAALGAQLTLVHSPTGGTTRALTLEMIDVARRIAAARPGSFWTDQLNNADVFPGYAAMADEIWRQCDNRVDGFVQAVGTAGSFRGIATRLRERNPHLQTVAVEPAESAVLSGGPTGSHRIEGTGPGFVPPHWRADIADAIRPVASDAAMAMARRLAREEGIFAGTSTGANAIAALELAARLGPEKTVVTIAVDSGMKYLSTALYGRAAG